MSLSLVIKSKSKKPPADFDLLSAMKPTEGLRWAHVLCSVWIPEVVFTKPSIFKTVENIMALPEEYWTSVRSRKDVSTDPRRVLYVINKAEPR